MMDKQLKTMSVNALIEELGACNSKETLAKLELITHSELKGVDNITREVVFKLLHYKSLLITGSESAMNKLIQKNDRLGKAAKIRFYDATIDMFKSLDISFLLGLLEAHQSALSVEDESALSKTAGAMASLMQLEGQFFKHVEDVRDLRKNLKEALLAAVELELMRL